MSDFFPTSVTALNLVLDQDAQVDQLRVAYGGTAGQNLQSVLTGAAVPEPSTYALILGFLALGGVLVRRQMRS